MYLAGYTGSFPSLRTSGGRVLIDSFNQCLCLQMRKLRPGERQDGP